MSKLLSKTARYFLPHLVVFGVLILLSILAAVGVLPPMGELSLQLGQLINEGGLGLIFAASFVENLPTVNAYFPGSVVLLVTMTSTSGDPARAVWVYMAVVVPAILANLLSFLAGRLMWQKRGHRVEPNRTKRVWGLVMLYIFNYWHPHLASMVALSTGSEGVTISHHLRAFLPVSLGWSLIWAVALYNMGMSVNFSAQMNWLVWVYLILWFLWDYHKMRQVV